LSTVRVVLIQKDIHIFAVGSAMMVFLALVGYPFTIDLETEQRWIDLRIGRLFRKIAVPEDAREAWQKILTRVVLTLSDLQLATGLAIIAIAFSLHCSISVYHFAVVSDMTWFTLGTHNTTLWLLRDYFRERRLLLYVRVFLMACLASVMISAVILPGHKDLDSNWNCKAQCMFGNLHGNIGGYPGTWMSLQLWWIIEGFVFAAGPHFPRPASLFEQCFYLALRKRFFSVVQESRRHPERPMDRCNNFHQFRSSRTAYTTFHFRTRLCFSICLAPLERHLARRRGFKPVLDLCLLEFTVSAVLARLGNIICYP
jgi:hypothetical protein